MVVIMISAGERRAVGLLAIAYGFLEEDDYESAGIVNKRITKLVDEVRESLFLLLKEYEQEGESIKKLSSSFLRKISFKNRNYVITNTQASFDLIYLALEPCEKRFKKLSPKVEQWYRSYRNKVLEVSYKLSDTIKYSETDKDSYDLAQFILDEVCK